MTAQDDVAVLREQDAQRLRQIGKMFHAEMSAAHLDSLTRAIAAIEQVSAQAAEIEALRRDAERYRWLRDDHSISWEEDIDAAMKAAGE